MKASRTPASAFFLFATATVLTACGGRATGSTSDGSSFPLGAYSDCTWLLAGYGFESTGASASLTLAPNGSTIEATFQSEGQPTATFELGATSDSSATLSAPGQGFLGQWGFCGGGAVGRDGGGVVVADPVPAIATLSMSSAELTVDQGVVFFQMEGPIVDVQGQPGCAVDGPPTAAVSALLVCGAASTSGAGGVGENAGDAGVTTATSSFVPGAYDCTSRVNTVVSYDGEQDNDSTGGTGTLALTANGASLSAAYSGDTYASGMLGFTLTSDSSANPVPGQTINVACGGFDPNTMMSANDPTVTQVTAGALTTDGTALYLTFLGNVPSGTCSGQTSTTALECTPKGQ